MLPVLKSLLVYSPCSAPSPHVHTLRSSLRFYFSRNGIHDVYPLHRMATHWSEPNWLETFRRFWLNGQPAVFRISQLVSLKCFRKSPQTSFWLICPSCMSLSQQESHCAGITLCYDFHALPGTMSGICRGSVKATGKLSEFKKKMHWGQKPILIIFPKLFRVIASIKCLRNICWIQLESLLPNEILLLMNWQQWWWRWWWWYQTSM